MPPTLVDVQYTIESGRLRLRGEPPLAWDASLLPIESNGEVHRFELDLEPGAFIEVKPIRDERSWALGRNMYVFAGDPVVLSPRFDRDHGFLEPTPRSLKSKELGGRTITFRVFLPPSYGEAPLRRYPALYVQDGQSQFDPDPFDGRSWELDQALDQLYSLDVIQEVIVVAIFAGDERISMLSPVADPTHGGGDGPRYLDFLVHTLKPYVDSHFRTRTDGPSTGMLGASMGGLFSFYAAWSRSDVFGRAACLSGSFWWANQSMVREVQKGVCPVPRPWLYVDSGVSKNMFENDDNLMDGFHQTVALRNALVTHCYSPGVNLEVLAFTGMRHDTASWAARLAIPLQLMFPREVILPDRLESSPRSVSKNPS